VLLPQVAPELHAASCAAIGEIGLVRASSGRKTIG
jgi:hypothetical protein